MGSWDHTREASEREARRRLAQERGLTEEEFDAQSPSRRASAVMQRIVAAYRQGKGIRLTPDEVEALALTDPGD